ncbi:uncharacterized protein [Chelonus insularis]|uniref:uncharacterized protein n=1 Tax=Chelonus insularis TaxID=460826 RepID=UPI00158887B6|nr:uncharacterized protein LOC118072970 [Chelonus insularis]
MDFITIELRPFIQSCYVFIRMKNETESSHIEIIVKYKAIVIKTDNDHYDIRFPSTITLCPASISRLEIVGKWIIFRVQTNPSNSSYGTFTCEFINTEEIKNDFKDTSKLNKVPPKNTNISLMCSCCKNILSNSTISFLKVLPLPSDECDPCEWFCCSHSNKIDYKALLSPTQQDFYYGSHFYILNKNIFTNLKINKTDILCNRCLSIIGVSNDDTSFKIWCHCIEYQVHSSSDFKVDVNTPLTDFQLALKYFLVNNDDKQKEICFFTNEQNQSKYLLLKVLEKNLSLLTDSVIDEVKGVNLKEQKITKVLFNCPKIELENVNSENLVMCQISLKCIIAGIEYLVSSSKRIPPMHRFIGEYCISYIM